MELPFKYIVFRIIKKLGDRKLPLNINKNKLAQYISEILKRSYFTMEEKKEIMENFDYEFELNDLISTYFQYFEDNGKEIVFDSDYIEEINILITNESNNYDRLFIHDIEFTTGDSPVFLELIGIKINKKLYEYLIKLEKDIEDCYNEYRDIESYIGISEVNTKPLLKKIKSLKLKKLILLLNAKNLLTNFESQDLLCYANDMVDKTTEFDEVSLLVEDDNFNQSDILYDVFMRSIFTSSDLYISCTRDKLITNIFKENNDIKYSKISFYLKFLELLNKEIENSDETMIEELIYIKYRLINSIDSVYDTMLLLNKNILEEVSFTPNYTFAETASYYFVDEVLKYEDDKYINKEYNTKNIMIYLNNILKKIYIKTYYDLTNSKKIIENIEKNKLYGINYESSNLLKEIVENSKIKKKKK